MNHEIEFGKEQLSQVEKPDIYVTTENELVNMRLRERERERTS